MIKKRIICPERVRRIPKQFSWIDHRLIRDGYIHRCKTEELALYLFLAAVGDAEGLSYYSDNSLCKQLTISLPTLRHARRALTCIGLIAYEKPLYQVLSLDRKPLNWPASEKSKSLSKGESDSSKFNPKPPGDLLQPRCEKTLHIEEIINKTQRRFET